MRLPYTLFILFTFAINASAQVRFSSLDELLLYADKNAPAAKQAVLQPRIAKQDLNVQASGLYPKVNAFASGDYYPIIPTQVIPAEVLGGKPGTYLKAQFGLPYVFVAGAELSIPVVNLEKWTQVAKAKALYHQSEWNSKAALEQFHLQLMQAYYQALVTKEVLKLNDENAGTSNELLRVMDERNKQGVVNPSDYNRSRNLQLDVQSSGIGYTRSLEQSVNNLNALLAIEKDSIVLDETLSGFDWPVLQTAADAANRAGWHEADLKLHTAELSLSESRKSALPRLALNSRYTYNMQSRFETGSNNVEFNSANVGLRLDVPLFQGLYYRSLINKNKLQLQSAKLEQQRTRASLSQQQQDWFAQYTAAYSKQAVLEQKVKTASDNLRIAKLNIQEGVMEFDEFNNIFIEYNKARMEYLQNLADGVLYYLLSTQKF